MRSFKFLSLAPKSFYTEVDYMDYLRFFAVVFMLNLSDHYGANNASKPGLVWNENRAWRPY